MSVIGIGFPNVEEYEEHPEIYIPEDLNIPLNSSHAKETLNKIREAYFEMSDLSVENMLLNVSIQNALNKCKGCQFAPAVCYR